MCTHETRFQYKSERKLHAKQTHNVELSRKTFANFFKKVNKMISHQKQVEEDDNWETSSAKNVDLQMEEDVVTMHFTRRLNSTCFNCVQLSVFIEHGHD